MPTRAECIRRAGELLAEQDLVNETRTPRDLAEAAWTPTNRLTVDELEDRIREDRGLAPKYRQDQ